MEPGGSSEVRRALLGDRLLWPCLSLLVRGVVDPRCRASVVGILEGRLAAFVEGADALDAVGMDGRPPMHVHHDRDRLLGRLPFAELDRPLDGLYRRGG